MLEPDQWDAVLSRVSGTIYRGTERISSNALLNLLEVGPDPATPKLAIACAGNQTDFRRRRLLTDVAERMLRNIRHYRFNAT
jgi:hypothetical protein